MERTIILRHNSTPQLLLLMTPVNQSQALERVLDTKLNNGTIQGLVYNTNT